MMVQENKYNYSAYRVYEWKNGEMQEIGHIGSKHGTIYASKVTNLLALYCVQMGSEDLFEYRIENGEIQSDHILSRMLGATGERSDLSDYYEVEIYNTEDYHAP